MLPDGCVDAHDHQVGCAARLPAPRPLSRYFKIAAGALASVGFAAVMFGMNAWQTKLLREQVHELARIAAALEKR